MKKQLTKCFVSLFVLLLVASLGVFPTPAVADQTNQNKSIDFMEAIMHIDLSKYTVSLGSDVVQKGFPVFDDNRIRNDIIYELSSEKSKLLVDFSFEKGVILMCGVYPLDFVGPIMTNKQYPNLHDAVIDFLETYQAYTNIDSSIQISMLNNIDITKNATTTTENIKLTVQSYFFSEMYQTNFRWEHIINGVAYNFLDLTFEKTGTFLMMHDTRALFTVSDATINISKEKAIDIAIANLKSYSYAMPDGSIVKDFKISKDHAIATLETYHFDYELRPYWDVRLLLDEVYPGNVFGISAFIWANTGEIIEYGNMASGGINYPDSNTNPADNATTQTPNSNILFIGTCIIAAIAVVAAGVLMAKKKQK
jgi:hypothetical protein